MTKEEDFARFARVDSLRRDLKSRSIRGATAMSIGAASDLVLRVGAMSILARLLTPEHFGVVGMAMAVTAVAAEISTLGLSAATVQRPQIEHAQVSNLFWINTAFGLALTLGLAAGSPLIAAFYREPDLVLITIVLGTSFFWNGLAVQHEALLSRQLRQAQMTLIRSGSTAMSAGIAVVLAWQGFGVWALVVQETSRNVFITLGMWLACPWRPSLPSRGADVRSFLRFGRDMTLTHLLNAAVSNLDRILIGRFVGAGVLGLYRQAQQLIVVPVEQLNAPLTSVSQPGLSTLQQDPPRYARYYERVAGIVALLTMPISAYAIAYAEEITAVLLGGQWTEAALFMRIFALGTLIRPVLGTAGTVLISSGQPDRLLRLAYLRNATLAILVSVGLIWGAEGVAVAQVVATFLLLVPTLAYSFARTPVRVAHFFRAIRAPSFASAAMCAGLMFLRTTLPEWHEVAALGVGFVAGCLLYGAAVLVLPEGRGLAFGLVRDARAALAHRRGAGP